MELNEYLILFLVQGGDLVLINNTLLGQLLDAEREQQFTAAQASRIRVLTVKAILAREEYDGKGIKALGPNETAQKDELERLLQELTEESEYKVTQHLLSEAETHLALLKTQVKQVTTALKHWEAMQELVDTTLMVESIAQELGPTIIEQAGRQMAKIVNRLNQSGIRHPNAED